MKIMNFGPRHLLERNLQILTPLLKVHDVIKELPKTTRRKINLPNLIVVSGLKLYTENLKQ